MADVKKSSTTTSETNGVVAHSQEEVPRMNGVNGKSSNGIGNRDGNSEKRLKVVQIGAGVAGIETAHQIQSMKNVDLTIYDKNPDLGGTWYENRYPGCACDVPAHSYSYNWAPNPNWSRWIVTSAEIHQYLTDVAEKHDLRKHMRLSHKVSAAEWDEGSAKWILTIVHEENGEREVIQDDCDFLISGTGVLNNWKWPKIDGLESFAGKLLHTAQWDPSYDVSGKRVAVLGNGASAIQVVPELQKDALHVDVYMRSPTWLTPTPWLEDGVTADKIYTEEEKARFANDPEYFLEYRKSIDNRVNEGWAMFYKGSKAQDQIRSVILERYCHVIEDPKLRKFLSPHFGVGCRRPTPADNFLAAIREKNVSVITKAATQMNGQGIVHEGSLKKYDVIVCATGFNTSFVPRFPIIGRNGINLQDVWRASLEAYMGLTVSGFPNYFCFSGPLSPIANGSVFPGTAMQSSYLRQMLSKMQKQNIRSLEVKRSAQDQYNNWAQTRMKDIVWSSGCESWYQDENGIVRVPFPGSLLHYRKMIERPLFEHFDIKYISNDAFGWLGNGRTQEELEGTVSDYSPYITAL